MPHRRFDPTDTLPLREGLRGLRFVLRRGGETLAETLNIEAMPRPAADVAGVVLREVGGLARSVDGLAAGMVKTILGQQDPPTEALQALIAHEGADALFGSAIYAALKAVLPRLGATSVFVSEAAARDALSGLSGSGDDAGIEARAAALTLRLVEARVLRGLATRQNARVPDDAVEATALFAVMLWLQSARSEAENEAAMDAATGIAVALSAEVAPAMAARDADRIAALYRKYVPHV